MSVPPFRLFFGLSHPRKAHTDAVSLGLVELIHHPAQNIPVQHQDRLIFPAKSTQFLPEELSELCVRDLVVVSTPGWAG